VSAMCVVSDGLTTINVACLLLALPSGATDQLSIACCSPDAGEDVSP